MAQVIQSGTDTFVNNYSMTTTKAVTFPTPLTSITNVQILATIQRTLGPSALRNVASISYDPSTLTTTGVTFTIIMNKGYVGTIKFDYLIVENT